MTATTVALIALIVASALVMLGNFWFTYGIWPQSWWSFSLFAIVQIVLSNLLGKVLKDIQ